MSEGQGNTTNSVNGHVASTSPTDDEHLTNTHIAERTNILASIAASLKWVPTSDDELAVAERDLLSVITRPFKTYFVDIGSGWGLDRNKIRTLEMLTDHEIKKTDLTKSPSKKLPLVLIHEFASGIGTWILNLDALSTKIDRKIYAFDIIGFGRSTRAPFDLNGDVEGQFVDSIEKWRVKTGIDKFVLLGHSFGGYLSASYALRHPERVSHVILADPWGVQDRAGSTRGQYRFPIWVRVVHSIFQSFTPLAGLRMSGPYGPRLLQKLRGDLREKFRPKLDDDCHKFLNYIYHCNAQSATGEAAFKALALPFGWPKDPLIHRLVDLDESVKMTFIYGSRSWIEKAPGEFIRDCSTPGRVTVNIIQGSGHHVYADKFAEFNELVREACSKTAE